MPKTLFITVLISGIAIFLFLRAPQNTQIIQHNGPLTSNTTPENTSVTEDIPFLLFGKRPTDLPSRFSDDEIRKYVDAIREFPNLESCFENLPAETGNYAIINLRISAFDSTQDLDVCLFRVFNRLPLLSEKVEWLKASGFSIIEEEADTNIYHAVAPKKAVGVSYVTASFHVPDSIDVGDRLSNWLDLSNRRGLSISVVHSKNLGLLEVRTTGDGPWQL
ncbi:MAG: hypothetical protein WCC57_17820 [Paracoccaceae bacterium]